MWKILKDIARSAAAMGEELYLVGGALRDLLLGQHPRDLDLSLASGALSLAGKVAQNFHGTLVHLDEERETLRVVLPSHSCLDFCLFKGRTIEEDLRARDFTANAMALNLTKLFPEANNTLPPENWQGQIIDPSGGRGDLGLGLLRATNSCSMLDDPQRVLRGVRLAAQFHLDITPDTVLWMKQGSRCIKPIAGERIWQEFSNILGLPKAYIWIDFMDRELELWQNLIPCRVRMEETKQNHYHTENVWRHCMRTFCCLELILKELPLLLKEGREILDSLQLTLAGGRSRLQVLKLAALIHDIGKPDTACTHKDGGISFHGHPEAGLPYGESLAGRLKFSNAEKQYLLDLILYHMHPLQFFIDQDPSDLALYRLQHALGKNILEILILSLADLTATHTAGERPGELALYRNFICQLMGHYHREQGFFHPGQYLSGKDLLALGVPEGPMVGKILEQLSEAQVTGAVKDVASARQWVEKRLKQNHLLNEENN